MEAVQTDRQEDTTLTQMHGFAAPRSRSMAVIFANGALSEPEIARRYAERADLLVAADGGTRHAMALGIVPHVVIGDLDSLDQELLARLRRAGTRFIEHPVAKDETDLELALLHAVEQDMDPIIILAALGLRLDQTIANILLLTMPALEGRDIRIIEGEQTAFVIRDEATINGRPGDTVSLIPLEGPARGVTVRGLAFPLDQATLPFGPALGVSNSMTAHQASVKVENGLLLCVHISNNEDAPDASQED